VVVEPVDDPQAGAISWLPVGEGSRGLISESCFVRRALEGAADRWCYAWRFGAG
jgi:hypothetical protein